MSSAPDASAPGAPRPWRGDTAIVLAALALLWLLTAAYIVGGAGMRMSALDMTRAAFWPHDHATSAMGSMVAWDPRGFVLMAAMWWTMMIAMMVPGAVPAVLLYARVHHRVLLETPKRTGPAAAPVGAFVAGYLLVWGAFALVATALHGLLEAAGTLAAGTMGIRATWLAGVVLVAAGLYQLSPWKNACLSQCRTPAAFLTTHWRPGTRGALRLGAWHGTYCLGCCWALMALLFVGGVMNLAWIAVLTLLVLAEKLLPGGRWIGRAAGVALIAWGLVIAIATWLN